MIEKYQNYGDNLPQFGGNIIGEKSHDYSFGASSGSGHASVIKLNHEPGWSPAGNACSGRLCAAGAPATAAGTARPNGTDDGMPVDCRPPGKCPRLALSGAPEAARQLGEAAVFEYAAPALRVNQRYFPLLEQTRTHNELYYVG